MKKSFLLLAIALLLPLLLTGCARDMGLIAGTVREITGLPAGTPLQKAKAMRDSKTVSPVVEEETVTVPPLDEPPPPPDYIVGPNDSIAVFVSGHPEMSSVGGKSRVDGRGNVQIPFLGLVKVGGKTLPEIQGHIQELLLKYLKEPSVVVEVAEYKSHPLYLLGQFRTFGTFYMDRPLKVLQGIALGNGYDITSANPRAARIIRDNKILPIDVYELLMNADQQQNVWLKSGDTIFMPDNKNRVVLVFGGGRTGISTATPSVAGGAIPIPPTGLNLLQAIAMAGMQDTGYNVRRAFIIRSLSPTRGQLMVVDVDKIIRGEAFPLPLTEGDIIYIPKSAITSWNEALSEILPTLSAFSAILQPFVQLKFLSQ